MALFGTDGERIAYELHPSATAGAPILLLQHGFTASWASFYANVGPLSEQFNVVLVELLGHGRSDAPEALAPYVPKAAVERLAGLIGSLGVEPVLFCGHSLGGGVGVRLALERPKLLSALIVLNSEAASGGEGWRERLRPAMEGMANRVREHGTDALRDSSLFPAHGRRLDAESRERLAADFGRLTVNGIAGTAQALVVDVNCFERLGELRVPTLIALGDRDASFRANAPAFVAAMPDDVVFTARIADAGHAANLEEPRVFERMVVRFAKELGLLGGEPVASLRGRQFELVT